ncbi:MAG: sigma-70 family RNA polymerase sigma factor [Chthoniobacter sp.]|uniref:sigma-70 family RNA polymerase sigma factor n=1 Tax=Chthoniobacter sp. TaxID=2510640 RepID=UPI0032A60477
MSSSDQSSDQQVALVQMLFVQHTAALRGFVHALMPDFGRADDIVQETFLTVTKKAGDFEPGTNFLGWVCSIARFKVMEAGRRAQRSTTLSPDIIESLCACEPEPEASDERLRHLSACLQKLAPQARQAVEMRYQQAHKPAEIARRLGWGAESVYVALSRARALLRECVARKLAEEAVQ